MRIVDIPTEPTPADLVAPKIEFFRCLCQADRLIREIAERDPRYNRLITLPLDTIRRMTEPERIGPECKAVRWYGRSFQFSNEQAPVVRFLIWNYRHGTARVHEKTLIARFKPEADEFGQKVRMLHTFRSGKTVHPAIGYMIFVDDGFWWVGRP